MGAALIALAIFIYAPDLIDALNNIAAAIRGEEDDDE